MSESGYRSAMHAAIRGLWSGVLDYDQFYENMLLAIRRYTTLAWYDGAARCGILPSDLKPEERSELELAIQYENQWIDGFAEAIEENSRELGGLLGPLYDRAEIWLGRYQGTMDRAATLACADKKFRWTLGETDHCQSCLKLDGKVKRGSYWHERGILPRVHMAWYLECQGFKCGCSLEETDEPCSMGPLPSLP